MDTTRRRTTQLAAVVLGVVAAVAGWLVATQVAGTTLELTSGGITTPIGLSQVVPASLVATLAGWAVLALLERRTSDPRTTWTALALAFAALSLLGPALMPGLETGDRVWLGVLHLLVAATYVPTMRRTLPSRRGTRIATGSAAAP